MTAMTAMTAGEGSGGRRVAINNWGGLGRWAFLEVTDPWDAEHVIRAKYLEPWPVEARA